MEIVLSAPYYLKFLWLLKQWTTKAWGTASRALGKADLLLGHPACGWEKGCGFCLPVGFSLGYRQKQHSTV